MSVWLKNPKQELFIWTKTKFKLEFLNHKLLHKINEINFYSFS